MTLCGGVSAYRDLTEEDQAIFTQCQTEINSQANGAELVAKQVATQVVNGINYRFSAVAGDKKFVVTIWKHSDGTVRVTNVTEQPA